MSARPPTRARGWRPSGRRRARACRARPRTARSTPLPSESCPDVSLRPVSPNADVAVVGGGIIGCALAAFLAEDGARVRLYEREEVAAGASGRNSGLLQHPMDAALTDIFAASHALYSELGHGFELPADPVGVLVLGEDAAALEATRAEIAARFPELRAEPLDHPHELEPILAEDLAGFRLETGRPVPPAAAT